MRGTGLVLLLMGLLLGNGRLLAQSEGSVISVSAEALATAVANADPGDTIEVTGGTYNGLLVVDKPLTILGIDWPVIDGDNKGTVVSIMAPDTTFSGFVIKNSGEKQEI